MEIYVGNLSDSITKTDLKNAFKPYGKVATVKLKKDLFTKKSKGYAFVVMLNARDAEAAIEALNGTELKGHTLKVSEYRTETQTWRRPTKKGPPF
jgi:RNA recognition motif-containing protein